MSDKTGGPAYPGERVVYEAGYVTPKRQPMPGMTLRDYFAAKAMQGMVCSIQSDNDYYRARSIAEQKGMTSISQWFAEDAYKQADAMLAERVK